MLGLVDSFFRQTVGIPMGKNCAPFLADLFLYPYENDFLEKLIQEGKRKLARIFSLSYRYNDNIICFSNTRFKKFISDIHLKELNISVTTEATSVASYLDLIFTRDENNNITTNLHDKHDTFGLHIVNPLCQAIFFHQHQPTVSMNLSSYARCCSNNSDFLSRHKALVTRLLSQGYKINHLSNTFKKFYDRHTDLVGQHKKMSVKCLLIVPVKMTFSDFFPRFVKAELIKLAKMAGVTLEANHAYSV